MGKIKPFDPSKPYVPRTPAQEAAGRRSFLIFRLRGLYAQAGLLTGDRRERAERAIDEELKAMGAEPETERRRKQTEELTWF